MYKMPADRNKNVYLVAVVALFPYCLERFGLDKMLVHRNKNEYLVVQVLEEN
jgi:hypothetical protein